MGYIRHHAIVITSCWPDEIKDIHQFADLCNLNPSSIIRSHVNGYESFFIPPDGSKEGWQESRNGDEERKRLKTFLRQRHPYADWSEISYGGDDSYSQIEDDCGRKPSEP